MGVVNIHAAVHMWRSEDKLQVSLLSVHYVNSGGVDSGCQHQAPLLTFAPRLVFFYIDS